MQQRQSPSVEVTASRSNDGEISAPSLPRNESGILQQKMDSAIESSDSGLSKVCTVSDDLSNADVEKPISGFGNISMSKSKSLATDSSQTSLLPDKVPNADSHKKLIPGNRNDGRLNVVFATPKKELDEPIVSPNARGHLSTSCMKEIPESGVQVSQFNQVSIVTKRDQDDSEPGPSPDTGRNPSTACAEGESDSVEHEKSLMVVHSTNTPIPTSSSDQEKMIYSGRPEKTVYKLQPRRNPDSAAHASQLEQEINSSRGREKALDDGYNWRKYGQKFVKGNVLVRSYYKCTFSNCRAKKQVERCHDGRLTDIKYIGRHEHPKPHSPQIPAVVTPLQAYKVDTPIATMSEEPSTPNAETSQSIEPAQSPRELTATENNNSLAVSIPLLHNPRDDDDSSSSNPKKQKRETASIDDNQVKKTYCDSRQVVQMMSEVDIVNDGYRWRKYGQKLVKGNPNPRSYYRCSSAGCTVKKHVERASHDPKVVITTYEGNHDHDMPASRTVVQSAAESGIKGATLNGENRSELGEPNQVGMEMVVRIGAN